MSKKKKTEETTASKKEAISSDSPESHNSAINGASEPPPDSPSYYLLASSIKKPLQEVRKKKVKQPIETQPPQPPSEWTSHKQEPDQQVPVSEQQDGYQDSSDSSSSSESSDDDDDSRPHATTNHTPIAVITQFNKMAQAQVKALLKKAFARKLDLNDKLTECTPEKIKSPYVNRSFWEHSGVLIRVFNFNTPDIAPEIGVIRLRVAHTELIPAILARERPKIKHWALQQVVASLKEAGYNTALDPKLTNEEWSMRYTVTSLSSYGVKKLGTNEAGLWTLHCPELIEETVLARYDDGSEDKCHILKLYVNLVPPEFRLRKIEGGWIKEEEPEEKRVKRQFDRPYNRPYDPRFRPRPYINEEEMAEKTAELIAAKTAALAKTTSSYPHLEPSKNPGAIQNLLWPETDIPNISCQF